MLQRRAVLTLCVLAASVFAAMAGDPPAPADAVAGAALIARAVDAFGGAAAVDGVKTLELKAKGTRKVGLPAAPGKPGEPGTAPIQRDLEVETTIRILIPDLYRQDVVLPFATMSTVVTPSEAFLAMADEGAMPLPEEQRANLAASFRRNLVMLLRARNEPSFRAAKIGSATIDGIPAELVKLDCLGDTLTMSIDSATGRILRLSAPNVGTGAGPTGELVVSYSDYRKAGPLYYPHVAAGTLNGQKVYESTLETIIVNGPLDPALFTRPPEPPPAPEVAGAPAAPAAAADPSAPAPPAPAPAPAPAPPKP